MSEYLRSVSVRIEVDTNKNTHLLHLPDLGDIETARSEIAEFLAMVEDVR